MNKIEYGEIAIFYCGCCSKEFEAPYIKNHVACPFCGEVAKIGVKKKEV